MAEVPRVSLVTEELKQAFRLGEENGPFVHEIDRSWIRRFAESVGDPNPLWHDEAYAKAEGAFRAMIAPPTFVAALDPMEREELRLEENIAKVPFKRVSGADAFLEVEYVRPIRVGDTISVTTTYTDIYEKEGRSGRLLFRIRENVLRNQRDEIVARVRGGQVTGYDVSQKKEG